MKDDKIARQNQASVSEKKESAEINQRYNQLLTTTQHLMKEVGRLKDYHTNHPVESLTAGSWESYYKTIGEGLERCQVFGDTIEQGKSLNDMIGFYLTGAKEKAAAIVAEAQRASLEREAEQHPTLQNKLHETQQQLDLYKIKIKKQEEELAVYKEKKATFSVSKDVEGYAQAIKDEADRYSRQRKLIADNQVLSAKKEMDDYADKRYQEIRLAEERLELLVSQLQEKLEYQVDGVLGSISEFAKSEEITL